MRFTCAVSYSALRPAALAPTCAAILHKLLPFCVDKKNLISSSSYISYFIAMLLSILHSYNFLLLSSKDNRFVETAVRHDSSFTLNATGGLFISTNFSWSMFRVCLLRVCVCVCCVFVCVCVVCVCCVCLLCMCCVCLLSVCVCVVCVC